MTDKYKAAYERQKRAREQAEEALEMKSRELFDSHQSLMAAYTKLKGQKAQLLHQEKLASIGQLSAGIAHEINNPTGYVKSNLTTLVDYIAGFKSALELYKGFVANHALNGDEKTKLEEMLKKLEIDYLLSDVDELLSDSLEGTQKIQQIVSNLKDFARADSSDAEPVSLNECVNDVLKIIEPSIKYKAKVVTELSEIPDVLGKKGELSQVILNLVTNAADAIVDQGEIKVRTYRKDNLACLSVSDTGSGIPPENLNRIFDPFFSTKEVGSGTGLGLSISHGIVKSHSGTLSVESEIDEGALFTIDLPCVKP